MLMVASSGGSRSWTCAAPGLAREVSKGRELEMMHAVMKKGIDQNERKGTHCFVWGGPNLT